MCSLYGQQDCNKVNEALYVLFSTASREENAMPPNRDSFYKHIQLANFQSAIYKRCLQQDPDIPSPVGHWWKMNNNALGIDWMDMQPAQESILELSSCTCKKSRCRASKADDNCLLSLGFPCTKLCTCKNYCNISLLDAETEEVGDTDIGVEDDEEENFEEEEPFQ